MNLRGEYALARVGIGTSGAVAGAIVARAAFFYIRLDQLAFGLSLLIATGLLLGILELLHRVNRAESLTLELARLPRPATLETVESSSPMLRAVLSARVAGARTSLAAATFTSYLLGLLVMLGLLGTFMGLFEALRGAREALTTSSDVEALRSGLVAPMSGLTRAFGTSAAGVAASAMLGLAAVFSRRVEAGLANAVNAYADGPLAPLTVAERQLSALQSLAARAEETSRATLRATATIEETALSLRSDLLASVAGVAQATEVALRPLVEQVVEDASAHAEKHLSGWIAAAERDATLRRERDLSQVERWNELANASGRAVAVQASNVVASLRSELHATLDSFRERQDRALLLLDTRASAQLGAEERAAARTLQHQEATLAVMATHVERLLAVQRERGEDDMRRVEEVERVLERHLTKLTTSLSGPLSNAAETAKAAAIAATKVLYATEQSTSRTDEVFAKLVATAEQVGAHAEHVLAKQEARQAALETRLESFRADSAEKLGAQLAQYASGIGASLGATGTLVEEAAGLMQAGGAEMGAVAELFTSAVERYREASDRCLATLSGVDEAVDGAGKKAAVELLGDYLDRTREVFEHSLEVQRELFAELRALRGRGQSAPAEETDVLA